MKNGILAASFGTTYKEARELSLGVIEEALSSGFPGFFIYKAYTSSIVKKRIQKNEGFFIPDARQALEQMHKDGIENVYIQPTHIIPGEEYNKISCIAGNYKDMFNILKVSAPLLGSAADFEIVADILGSYYNFSSLGSESAVVLMGHGSGHEANKCYSQFQDILRKKGYKDVFVSTVEGTPAFDDLLIELDKYTYKNITLIPFMVTAGDHVHNDMAGSSKGSWKSKLESIGYNITAITHGIGEIKEIQDIYLTHLESVVNASI